MTTPIRDIFSLVDKFIAKYGRLPTEFDPDYLEMLRMSKYRILAVPDVSPGKCANCGASKNDGRKYVDFGLQIDWYGAVFLCGECLHDISDAMGLFLGLQDKLSQLQESSNHSEELKDQGVRLHTAIVQVFKEFEEYYGRVHSLGVDSSSDPTPSVVADAAAIKQGINQPKPRTTKSTPGSGSKDIRSLTELLNDSELDGV